MNQPTAAVLMTRRNWAGVCACMIEYAHALIDERDPTGIVDEELEEAIRDYVQKMIPVIYHAADRVEWPELDELYKGVISASGYVVPEHYEDLGKQLVQFGNGDQ